ncbi:carboxypeptidase regulatory-like domain-containing protein [Paenibacillus mendelii]|uniref:OmpL47-type beta-barrel domain-containing protein n=1 Tax=Paenibacillus mendelii TaxID=206163 RepID=A0ABV6JEV1_9BACL|nr:carboxypeptidase regulatory-like domain-containing protein [Paenibacillus mendelii]MCQ6557319.1 carboxypeptidase-like regulatory domain-containing protein [Paenibacillus mendelii]
MLNLGISKSFSKWAVILLMLAAMLSLSTANLVFAEEENPPLQGTITDENGQAIQGVELEVNSFNATEGQWDGIHGTAVTDENGHYSMVMDRSYYNNAIMFTVKGIKVVRYIHYSETSFDFQIPAVLERAEGTITLEDIEAPAPGVTVQVISRLKTSKYITLASGITDENGHYSIPYIATEYGQFTTFNANLPEGGNLTDGKTTVPVATSGAFYGYVYTDSNDTLFGAVVELGGKQFVTNASGGFAFFPPLTDDHIKVSAYGYLPFEGTIGSVPMKIVLPVSSYPTVEAIPEREPDANGWYNHDVLVEFKAEDADDSQPLVVDPHKLVQTEGANQIISGTATDSTGLTGYGEVSISLDKTSPTTVAALTPVTPDGGSGWYKQSVGIQLTASDGLSGVASTEYSMDDGSTWLPYAGTLSLDTEGTHHMKYRSTDTADNVESVKSISIPIDRTAPVIQIISPQETDYNVASDIKVRYTLTDHLSGVDLSRTSAKLDGQAVKYGDATPLYTMTLGQHTLTVTSSDGAGNVSSAAVTFRTYTNLTTLEALVTRFTNNGWITAKTAKSLQKQLEKGDLGAFIHEVEKSRNGKGVTKEAVQYLLRDAHSILDSLILLVNQYTQDQSIKRASVAKDLLRELNKGELKDFARTVDKQSDKHITAHAAKSLLVGLEHLLKKGNGNE